MKWLEQLLAERQGQGVGGEKRQEVTGATFGAGTWEWLIPKPGELPASCTCAAQEWAKRGNTGEGCGAKPQSHLKSVAKLHRLRLALGPEFICSEGLLVQLFVCADEQ